MFSKDLKLEDLSEENKVVLIDTPGWSHETSTNIKSEYKKVSWFCFIGFRLFSIGWNCGPTGVLGVLHVFFVLLVFAINQSNTFGLSKISLLGSFFFKFCSILELIQGLEREAAGLRAHSAHHFVLCLHVQYPTVPRDGSQEDEWTVAGVEVWPALSHQSSACCDFCRHAKSRETGRTQVNNQRAGGKSFPKHRQGGHWRANMHHVQTSWGSAGGWRLEEFFEPNSTWTNPNTGVQWPVAESLGQQCGYIDPEALPAVSGERLGTSLVPEGFLHGGSCLWQGGPGWVQQTSMQYEGVAGWCFSYFYIFCFFRTPFLLPRFSCFISRFLLPLWRWSFALFFFFGHPFWEAQP